MIELADLRSRLDVPVADQARLSALRDAVVAQWEAATARPWQRAVDVVELHRCPTLRVRSVYLQRLPVESVSKVEEVLSGNEWNELDAEAWWFDGRRVVEKINSFWHRLVRVTYTGGVVATPADETQFATPADIREALLVQAVFLSKRNDSTRIALRSEGLEKAQTSFITSESHPLFAAAVRQHRRRV